MKIPKKDTKKQEAATPAVVEVQPKVGPEDLIAAALQNFKDGGEFKEFAKVVKESLGFEKWPEGIAEARRRAGEVIADRIHEFCQKNSGNAAGCMAFISNLRGYGPENTATAQREYVYRTAGQTYPFFAAFEKDNPHLRLKRPEVVKPTGETKPPPVANKPATAVVRTVETPKLKPTQKATDAAKANVAAQSRAIPLAEQEMEVIPLSKPEGVQVQEYAELPPPDFDGWVKIGPNGEFLWKKP